MTDHTKFYGFGHIGWVENNDVGVQREFGGVDLRLTNTSIKGLSVTAYAKNYNQSGETPTTALSSIAFPTGTTAATIQGLIPNPFGYNRYTSGIKGSYRPWAGGCADSCLTGLTFTAGYEYDYLIRVNENWQEANRPANPRSCTSPTRRPTRSPAGVQTPLTSDLHAYGRYKLQLIDGNLVGFTPDNGNVNSSLPDLRNVVELGCEWFPSTRFGASFNQEINVSGRHGGPVATTTLTTCRLITSNSEKTAMPPRSCYGTGRPTS